MERERTKSVPRFYFGENIMGIFGDFYDAAAAKVSELNERFQTIPTNTQQSIGSSIFEAVYQYGRGNVDVAREKLVTEFMKSGEGKKVVSAAENIRIQQLMPWIIGAAILLLGAGFLIRK